MFLIRARPAAVIATNEGGRPRRWQTPARLSQGAPRDSR